VDETSAGEGNGTPGEAGCSGTEGNGSPRSQGGAVGVVEGGTGSSDRGAEGVGVPVTGAVGDDEAGGTTTGGTCGAGGKADDDVTTGGAALSELDGGTTSVGSSSRGPAGGSFRPVTGGFPPAVLRTVSVTVDTATRVCVANRAARTSRAAPSTTTVSVTVDSEVPVSNGSVHHCDVGRAGGGAASGASSGDPVSAINANMPPSAKNGTTTTAPKHPRPLRGSSR
jgi:hypothetical protein